MAEIDLTQEEADALIAVEKHSEAEKLLNFPGPGERLAIKPKLRPVAANGGFTVE
jgi:hypothetical protein